MRTSKKLGRRLIVRNILANWSYFIVRLASGLLLVRLATDCLGQTKYGAWGLIGGILQYLAISTLSISHAVPKFVAEYHTKEEYNMTGEVVGTAATLMLCLTGMFVLITAVFGYYVPKFVESFPIHLATQVFFSSIIMGANLGLTFTGQAYLGGIQGLQRYVPSSIVQSSLMLMKLGFVFFVFKIFQVSLVAFALGQLSATLVFVFLASWLSRRIFAGLEIKLWSISKRIFRRMIKFLAGMSLLTLVNTIGIAAIPFIIGIFYGLKGVASFAVVKILSEAGRPFILEMTRTLVPMSSSLAASESGRAKLSYVHTKASRYCAVLSGGLVVILLAYGNDILRLIAPKVTGAYPLLIIIGICSFATWSQSASVAMLVGMGKIRAMTYAQALSVTAGIILAIALAMISDWGIGSVVLAIFACASLKDLFWLGVYASSSMGTPVVKYYMDVYRRPMLVVAATAFVAITGQILFPVVSLSKLLGHLLLMFVVFVTMFLLLAVYPDDRKAFLTVMKRNLNKISRICS